LIRSSPHNSNANSKLASNRSLLLPSDSLSSPKSSTGQDGSNCDKSYTPPHFQSTHVRTPCRPISRLRARDRRGQRQSCQLYKLPVVLNCRLCGIIFCSLRRSLYGGRLISLQAGERKEKKNPYTYLLFLNASCGLSSCGVLSRSCKYQSNCTGITTSESICGLCSAHRT
jgi:hypothetical protein